ncbi:MAG: nucleotidyl transferase AbiEii/AbiGii toxin family protein [Bacteroidales bacterium]|nr:nucleotidyl transferase AbiEii/AbiGii toxin family protein [Bacteroidales bacterium]
MNYNISSKNFRDPLLKSILISLQKVFSELDINFYLIGATARDIILNLHGVPPKRATHDLDIAVAVSNWDKYQIIENKLLKIKDFKKDKNQKQRFIYKDVFPLDIVPFGEIKNKDDKIYWPPDETVAMSVLGFDEVETNTKHLIIDNDLTVNVASLPGIFILKLFAWKDRYTEHEKDADDMAFIITNYLGINQERAVNEHYNEIYLSDDFTQNTGSAVLLAYDIYEIIKTNGKTINKAIQIFQKEISLAEESKLINQMLETHPAFNYDETHLCLKKIISVLKRLVNV